MDAERADRVADEVTEERVFVLRRLHDLTLLGVSRRQHQTAVHRQCQRRREEQARCNRMRRVVVEVQVLVGDVTHPVQVTVDAVRERMAPRAHQHRSDHLQCEVREDREAEGHRHVVTHAELSGDFYLAQHPGHEGPQRTHGDDLPQPAFHHRRHAQPVGKIWRRDADLPEIPGRAHGRAPQNHSGAHEREEHGGDTEKAHEERAHPEVEQVASDEGAAANPVLSFKTQHGHVWILRPACTLLPGHTKSLFFS